MKSQTKIALLFSSGCLLIIILLSISVYYFSTQYSFTDFYKRLEIRAIFKAKSTLESEDMKAQAFKEVREQHLEILPQERDYVFEVNSNTTFDSQAKNMRLPLSFFTELVSKKTANYKNNNTFYSGILYQTNQKKYAVIVSANNYYNTHHLAYLRNIFLIAIPLASLLAVLIAIFVSKKVLNPVTDITAKVKQISSESMHLRLATLTDNDELSQLITTFNTMLDRLETAFETQNNFISNASHELSTPLTAIIGEADVTLNKKRKSEEYETSIKIILGEAERLEKITKSLLFLAQTGFDGKKQKMEIVRTDQLLWDVKETIDKLNPNNQIRLDLSLMPDTPEKLKINGNSQLLHLALSNIVSNACKYSSNKPVQISIGASQHQLIIIIKDAGIGIPESELKYIYDPFFRASNTKNFEGYGIGLPLARNIIRLHKGTITVTAQSGQGTTVELRFPSIH
ncbi:MAG: ATP-binding protein [Bacteroidota bacterium]